MKKEDLKTGMVVETRNGERYIVIKDIKIDNIISNIAIDETGYLDLAFYNKLGNREDSDTECFDIVKVYKSKNCNLFISKNRDSLLDLIWERKELTERERAYLKAYSYDYEWVARDKNGDMYIYKEEKPTKGERCWNCSDIVRGSNVINETLCKFIKWEDEEPYKIKDLLGEE